MSHVFVCHGSVWNEDEREYVGGDLEGLNLRCDIHFQDFLLELYNLSGLLSQINMSSS